MIYDIGCRCVIHYVGVGVCVIHYAGVGVGAVYMKYSNKDLERRSHNK